MIVASSQTTIGTVVLVFAIVLAIVYAFVNVRQAKAELGSEVELAPNRKPYYDDEVLEGKRLDRVLQMAMVGIVVCAIGVPLYWLNEPGRQQGAVKDFKRKFESRGAEMFAPTGDNIQALNCAGCHGGMKATGGTAPYTITDPDGHFVQAVEWRAPALNTVLLRFSRPEVRYILTYGRPFSPMPAWGLKGGGALNDQQIQNLLDYLESIQITPAQANKEVTKGLKTEKAAAVAAGKPYATDGEALFNLGYYSGFAGGAYSCGRCHTQGWSYGQKELDGGGAMGPNLTNGDTLRQFPGAAMGFQQQFDFVCKGSEQGKLYGVHGQGTGRMPGYCNTPEQQNDTDNNEVGVVPKDAGTTGMMTPEQVKAIVQYERSL